RELPRGAEAAEEPLDDRVRRDDRRRALRHAPDRVPERPPQRGEIAEPHDVGDRRRAEEDPGHEPVALGDEDHGYPALARDLDLDPDAERGRARVRDDERAPRAPRAVDPVAGARPEV